LIGAPRHQQGLADSVRQPFLAPALEVELELAVDPPQPRLAAGPVCAQGVIKKTKDIPTVFLHMPLDGRNHQTVITDHLAQN